MKIQTNKTHTKKTVDALLGGGWEEGILEE
jgi:hypothetical protein